MVKYGVFTTKEKIIEASKETDIGGFVKTYGDWYLAQSPEQFKQMLEHYFGFDVIQCYSTPYSTAIAITKCGLKIGWNGHCSIVK